MNRTHDDSQEAEGETVELPAALGAKTGVQPIAGLEGAQWSLELQDPVSNQVTLPPALSSRSALAWCPSASFCTEPISHQSPL